MENLSYLYLHICLKKKLPKFIMHPLAKNQKRFL